MWKLVAGEVILAPGHVSVLCRVYCVNIITLSGRVGYPIFCCLLKKRYNKRNMTRPITIQANKSKKLNKKKRMRFFTLAKEPPDWVQLIPAQLQLSYRQFDKTFGYLENNLTMLQSKKLHDHNSKNISQNYITWPWYEYKYNDFRTI
jgi:hypothetical protein